MRRRVTYAARVNTDDVRERLSEERSRLEGLRSNFDDEHLEDQTESDSFSELSSVAQHQADLGTETFEREKDLSILERIEGELADIEHALRRLDDDTYGTCEACGQAIDEARLEAMPATRLCLEHQASAEREARNLGSASSELPGLD